jgi:hypothetical protein
VQARSTRASVQRDVVQIVGTVDDRGKRCRFQRIGSRSPLAARAKITEAMSALMVDVRLASGSIAVASSNTDLIRSISSGRNTAPVMVASCKRKPYGDRLKSRLFSSAIKDYSSDRSLRCGIVELHHCDLLELGPSDRTRRSGPLSDIEKPTCCFAPGTSRAGTLAWLVRSTGALRAFLLTKAKQRVRVLVSICVYCSRIDFSSPIGKGRKRPCFLLWRA